MGEAHVAYARANALEQAGDQQTDARELLRSLDCWAPQARVKYGSRGHSWLPRSAGLPIALALLWSHAPAALLMPAPWVDVQAGGVPSG